MHFQHPGYFVLLGKRCGVLTENEHIVFPYRPATAPAAPMETKVPLANSASVSTVAIALVLFLAMLMIVAVIVYLPAIFCRMYDSV